EPVEHGRGRVLERNSRRDAGRLPNVGEDLFTPALAAAAERGERRARAEQAEELAPVQVGPGERRVREFPEGGLWRSGRARGSGGRRARRRDRQAYTLLFPDRHSLPRG